jgi:3-oxoacyl-[acyl-carrier-protein] synthase III
MIKVGILGLGAYLPKKVLTNKDLEKMVETSDEWIRTRTGIVERRLAAEGEKTSDLATNAAREALENAKLTALDIDLILVATISPDSNFPAVACIVQKNIGASKAIAFDISAACSGYVYALTTAKQYILSGMAKHVLVIAAEKITSLVDWTDRTTCVLFGDGAGACVVGPVQEGGIIADYMLAYGDQGELMRVEYAKDSHKPLIIMQGPELFKMAVNSMADAVDQVLAKANLTKADVKLVVPHQANDRIISAVANKLDIPKDKIFINIEKYGNMSAASIAVALYEAVKTGAIKKGDTIVLVVFGAGLVAGANVIKW